MATIFYFPSSGTPPVTNIAFDANWSNTASAVKLPLNSVKGNSTLTNFSVTESTLTTVHNVLVAQFISETLAEQDLSGTVVGIIQAMENNSSADYNRAIVIKLVDSFGKLKGNLYSNFPSTLAERLEFGTSLSSRWYPQSTNITNMTSSTGDRIVVEVGFKAHNIKSTQYIGTLRFGENGNSDIPYNSESNTVTSLNPSIEFSANIKFSYRVQIDKIGNGIISPTVGIYTYITGDIVNLTAINSNNSYFVKWEINGVVDLNANTSVVVNKNMFIKAYFETRYTLTVNKVGTGIMFPDVGDYNYLENNIAYLNANGFIPTKQTNSNCNKGGNEFKIVYNTIFYVWFENINGNTRQIWTATSNLDGSNFIATKLTNTDYDAYFAVFQISSNTIIYCWLEMDALNKQQIWMATSNLDGSNFKATKLTNTPYNKVAPNIQYLGSIIYYYWLEYDSFDKYQIWVATSNLDGSNFKATKLTNTPYNKSSVYIQFTDDTIYCAWFEYDATSKYQIWVATSNLDGSNFIATKLTNTPYVKVDFKVQIFGSTIYYVWIEYDSLNIQQIWVATSNLDGSNFVSAKQTSTAHHKSEVYLQVVGDTIFYIWHEYDSFDKYQIWTATSNLDGSNFKATKLTNTPYNKHFAKLIVIGNTIYYTWFENLGYFQLFSATHVLNQNFDKWIIDGEVVQSPTVEVNMSKNITATAYFNIPLSDVTNLSVSKISVNSLRLNWTPSNSQDILYLELFKGEIALSPRPDNSAGSYIIDSIDTTKAYTFTIYVYDSNLNRSNGASVTYYPSTPIINSIAWSKNPCNTNEATLLQVSVIEQ